MTSDSGDLSAFRRDRLKNGETADSGDLRDRWRDRLKNMCGNVAVSVCVLVWYTRVTHFASEATMILRSRKKTIANVTDISEVMFFFRPSHAK